MNHYKTGNKWNDLKKYEFADHFFKQLNKELEGLETNPDKIFYKYVDDEDGIILSEDFEKAVKRLTKSKRLREDMESFLEEMDDEINY